MPYLGSIYHIALHALEDTTLLYDIRYMYCIALVTVAYITLSF